MEESGAALHGEIALACSFCDATETLPSEPAERVRVLRRRLQQIAWARQTAEAPALAMANAIEAWKRSVVIVFAVVGVFVLVQLASAFDATQGEVSALTLLPAFIQLAVMLSAFAAAFLGMRAYAEAVRPGLLAFAPREAGQSPRCRCCGGNLTGHQGAGAFVTCTYCQAPNLLSAGLTERRRADLERELEAHRARAAGLHDAMAEGRKKMMRASAVGTACGIALSVAGYAILAWAL